MRAHGSRVDENTIQIIPSSLPTHPLQVHQNVHDVSYHVTQYHKIIAELRRKVQRLQEQLAQAHGGKEERGGRREGERREMGERGERKEMEGRGEGERRMGVI